MMPMTVRSGTPRSTRTVAARPRSLAPGDASNRAGRSGGRSQDAQPRTRSLVRVQPLVGPRPLAGDRGRVPAQPWAGRCRAPRVRVRLARLSRCYSGHGWGAMRRSCSKIKWGENGARNADRPPRTRSNAHEQGTLTCDRRCDSWSENGDSDLDTVALIRAGSDLMTRDESVDRLG